MTMPPDPLGVQIGAREIYDRLGDVDRKVDRLIGRQDGLAEDIAEVRAESRGQHADHEARMRSLERRQWPLPSLAALLAVASLAVAVLSYMAKAGG